MKTISIQQQFDILLIMAQVGCSKMEAIAASKGWGFKTLTAEKAEEIKDAVAKVAARRNVKSRKAAKTAARRGGRKNTTFPRFVGSLVTKVTSTRRPSVATKVAEVLIASAKTIAAFKEVAANVPGWTKEVAALNAAYQDALMAVRAAKAAL